MKQYCRYCNNANQVDDGLVYCSVNREVMNESKAKRVNTCKSFEFNKIDVFDLEHEYAPIENRTKNRKTTGKQMNLFQTEVSDEVGKDRK